MGHGEWVSPEEETGINKTMQLDREPHWIYKWRCNNDEDIKLHQEVWDNGYPNRWGAKRPIKTKWNLDRFKELLIGYEDVEVVEWMKYGWPTGKLPTLPDPAISNRNHKGATDFPRAMENYIMKEINHGAVMGHSTRFPFRKKWVFHLSAPGQKRILETDE